MRKHLREESVVDPRNNIVAVLVGPDGRVKARQTWYGANIVTNTGDQYYAEAAVASGSVMSVVAMRLGSSAVAPTKSDTDVGSPIPNGSAAIDSGYPRTADNDAASRKWQRLTTPAHLPWLYNAGR
jgi:hypothetical protein